MSLRTKVTFNDSNQLLSRFTHMDSGVTSFTPAFSVDRFEG